MSRFSGDGAGFSGHGSYNRCISADMPHTLALSAEESHRWRMSPHIGREYGLFAHNSDNQPVSANNSNNGGMLADIWHIDAIARAFPASRWPRRIPPPQGVAILPDR